MLPPLVRCFNEGCRSFQFSYYS